MPNQNEDSWYQRLPGSEQMTIDSLRAAGFIVGNHFS